MLEEAPPKAEKAGIKDIQFLAADIMAFSKALMRIALSMPFSLLTCSMTRLSSGCIIPSLRDYNSGS